MDERLVRIVGHIRFVGIGCTPRKPLPNKAGGYFMRRPRKRSGATPFSKILLSLMEEKGMTIRQASILAGVAPSTIDDWRAGALPEDYSAVHRLAKGLGVSLSFILTGEEDTRDLAQLPTISEVFEDGGALFDGYAKITIQRLVPRTKKKKE